MLKIWKTIKIFLQRKKTNSQSHKINENCMNNSLEKYWIHIISILVILEYFFSKIISIKLCMSYVS